MNAHGIRPVWAGCLLLGVLLACAEQPTRPEGLQITGLVIQNGSRSYVHSVSLKVPSTGGFVSCGNIPPGGACANTFPQLYYSGAPIEVTWNQQGEDWSTGNITLDIGEPIRIAGEATVQVLIVAPGSAGASLRLPVP